VARASRSQALPHEKLASPVWSFEVIGQRRDDPMLACVQRTPADNVHGEKAAIKVDALAIKVRSFEHHK